MQLIPTIFSSFTIPVLQNLGSEVSHLRSVLNMCLHIAGIDTRRRHVFSCLRQCVHAKDVSHCKNSDEAYATSRSGSQLSGNSPVYTDVNAEEFVTG